MTETPTFTLPSNAKIFVVDDQIPQEARNLWSPFKKEGFSREDFSGRAVRTADKYREVLKEIISFPGMAVVFLDRNFGSEDSILEERLSGETFAVALREQFAEQGRLLIISNSGGKHEVKGSDVSYGKDRTNAPKIAEAIKKFFLGEMS